MPISKNSEASVQERLSTTGIVSKNNCVAVKVDLGTSLQSSSENVYFEDNAASYADADPGVQDPQGRSGWYYTNENPGDKINWYFYDGTSTNTVPVNQLDVYAVVTVDSVESLPFLATYTRPTGTDDIFPGFAHASQVYVVPSSEVEAGGKYVFYVGNKPCGFDDLPKVELQPENTRGDWSETDIVMTTSFHTNSAADPGDVQILVEVLAVSSESFSQEIGLRIRSSQDASNDAIAKALEFMQPLMYDIKDNYTGEIHAILNESGFDAESLQNQIRSIGNSLTGYDFSNAVVTTGSLLTVE